MANPIKIFKEIKTIQQRLDEIDYTFNGYTPSIETLMFVEFMKKINEGGKGEENTTPLIHLKMLDLLFDPNTRNKAIMCFRGASKTTLMEYMILYGMCFNRVFGLKDVTTGMYVANSLKDGAKQFRHSIEQRIRESAFLQEMIPMNKIKISTNDERGTQKIFKNNEELDNGLEAGIKFTDVSLDIINKNGKPFYVKLFGITTGIRGFKAYGERPFFCVLDDVLKDSEARSEATITTIEESIYRAIPYALHPTKRMMIWCGTPFNSKDPLYKAIESNAWKSVLFPIAEKFPCEEKDFKGAWEDRFPYEAVKQQWDLALSNGQEQGFRQEMMLQIIPSEGLLVPPSKIIELSSETFNKVDQSMYNYYITTDFAYTDKEHSDYSVISIWAVNNHKDYILCDGFCGKALIDRLIDMLFQYVSKYKPLQVGFEITGQQIGFVNLIMNEMVKRNIFFNIKEIRPSKDKFSRFNLASPLFHQQKIKILSSMMSSSWGTEFKDEINKATIEGFKSKHDDVLDTISQLLDLEVFAPINNIPSSSSYNSVFDEDSRSSIIF